MGTIRQTKRHWLYASMRPQPGGCGNVKSIGNGEWFCRCFNEAAARRLRKFGGDIHLPQRVAGLQ